MRFVAILAVIIQGLTFGGTLIEKIHAHPSLSVYFSHEGLEQGLD